MQLRQDMVGLTPGEQNERLKPSRPVMMVQASGGAGEADSQQIKSAAATGLQQPSSPMPHLEAIQQSFGGHDIGGVKAHVGGLAAQASTSMGASAYTTGNDIGFKSAPDLHTAAHEAAHVVQQRAGVNLSGGVGRVGDAYEKHADAVADRVVQGRSAESLLNTHSGRSASQSGVQQSSVQRDPDDKAPPQHFLNADGNIISDWAAAVFATAIRWERICKAQTDTCNTWYNMAKEEDPPPAWVGILKAAITIGVGALTGGIGAVVVSGLVNATTKVATEFIINAAVEAGKGIVQKAAEEGVNLVSQTCGGDGLLAYAAGQQETINKVVNQEQLKTLATISTLAKLPEDQKWQGLNDLYKALEKSRADAAKLQMAQCVEGWFSMLAQNKYGKNLTIGGVRVTDIPGITYGAALFIATIYSSQGSLDGLSSYFTDMLDKGLGKNWRNMGVGYSVSTGTLVDEWATSSVGTIGFHLKTSYDPTQSVTVQYCEMESSKGNNKAIRTYFLNSPKPVKDYKMPKVVIAEEMWTRQHSFLGNFSLAWDESSKGLKINTYGGGAIKDDSDDNAGRSWIAMHGKNTKSKMSASEVSAYLWSGVARIEKDVLGKSLKGLGVGSIDT
ncbi:MAG: DUF4157 domain-containing protein [Bradymonadales bacterium]|nr:DUF4157 domain-containing protein [Bradymonadales bacterium]